MTATDSGITTQKAGKILAVNSDPEVIRILGVNLTHANMEFISAQSGVEAIDKTFSERPDIILLGPPLPDMDTNDIYLRLQRSPQTNQIPIIVIGSTKSMSFAANQAENGTIHYITKPFDPNEIVYLVQTHLRQRRRVENVHPLTGLPNQSQVALEMAELIDRKQAFALVYIVIDNLTIYNKAYGYLQGDRAIRLLAGIITEKVRIFGNRDDLVGHVSGNKFAIISTPPKARSLCHRITAKFNQRIRDLYTGEEMGTGYASSYEKPGGSGAREPVMSLRTALVTSRERAFRHYLEVYDAVTEQLDRPKRLPDDESPLSLQADDTGPEMATAPGCVSSAQREELRVLSGALDWLDFTIGELDTPLNIIRDNIASLAIEGPGSAPGNTLQTVLDKVNRLSLIVEGLRCLTGARRPAADAIFEEADIADTLDWVRNRLRDILEQRDIQINIAVTDGLSPISVDRRALTECLLYLVRSETCRIPPGGHLEIRATEMNEEFLTILINNPGHHTSQSEPGQIHLDELKNRIYPAKLMLQGLGGKLSVLGGEEGEIVYTLVVPKRWHSWMQETGSLQQATETSRKEAQSELVNIRHWLSTLSEQVPPAMKDSLDIIRGKIQELGVLCNRTLFLTEDLNSRLEIQQASLLQQEVEQLASLEAILEMGREIAGSMNLEWVFSPERARLVSEYALSIAREYKLPEGDCRSLRYAAMINDLGLVLSPRILIELTLISTEEASRIRECFSPMWKALSGIPFLKTALLCIRYVYNMYDEDGGYSATKGADIPPAAKILYLASSFERLTSGLPSPEKLNPHQALNRITDKSGWCFDPDILNTFLQVWRHYK